VKEQKGLNLNATDGLGNTALHYSAHHDHPGNSRLPPLIWPIFALSLATNLCFNLFFS
jgi:hypothetical protein